MRAFEIALLKVMDLIAPRGSRLLVACSGGRDSMALLHAVSILAPRRGYQVSVAYVHHGPTEGQMQIYREQALEFVQQNAEKWGMPFHALRSEIKLNSEAEFRRFRRGALEALAHEKGYIGILTAHHRDDLAETRWLRILRGVGPEGFGAMSLKRGLWLRPLLGFWRMEIEDYVKQTSLSFLEDPSNRDVRFSRNWLRERLFPFLEKEQPGSLRAAAHSFENLARAQKLPICWDSEGILRNPFTSLGRGDQRRVLARYMNAVGLKNYTSGHIEEIIKRLDTDQKGFTFKCLKRSWQVDTQHIRVES